MKLRTLPEDFVVVEKLRGIPPPAPAWSKSTPFAHWRLTKTGLTTPDACSMLARAAGLRSAEVVPAGLKDRHAVTTQTVSASIRTPHDAALIPPRLQDARWTADLLGFFSISVAAKDIHFNRFTIVARHLTREDADAIRARVDALTSAPRTLRALNLFGEQRFGSARHGEGFAAPFLIKGDFLGALKLLIGTPARKDSGPRRALTRAAAAHWPDFAAIANAAPPTPERQPFEVLARGGTPVAAFTTLPHFLQQMSLDAFQSMLWNDIATRLTATHTAAADPLPETLDLPNPHATYPPVARATVDAVLTEHHLTLSALTIPNLPRPRFSRSTRPFYVEAADFEISTPERDELSKSSRGKVTLTFSLPSAAYATTILHALEPGAEEEAQRHEGTEAPTGREEG